MTSGPVSYTHLIVEACALASYGTTKFTYEGTEIDVKGPWPRLTMAGAVQKYTGQDFDACETIEDARKIADKLHVEDVYKRQSVYSFASVWHFSSRDFVFSPSD